jgi:GSCFA family
VLTLSPVPLKGTFRGISSLSADCVSKSVLRVAIDQVISEGHRGVYYWPSFEIVKWAGVHLAWPAYGLDDGKTRHVTRRLVAEIVDAFVESFFLPEALETIRRRASGSDRAA